jgi:hypothetical protein
VWFGGLVVWWYFGGVLLLSKDNYQPRRCCNRDHVTLTHEIFDKLAAEVGVTAGLSPPQPPEHMEILSTNSTITSHSASKCCN